MQELILRGPHIVHPEKHSAVGSRNSLNRGNRNEYTESQLVIDEEVDKILNHISSKLPPEALEKLNVQGNIKELLHNYYNHGFQNVLNRYITTVEDELAKKYRDLIDKDETRNLARYTPRLLSELLDVIGGFDKFNTREVEQSIVNIYGHLQGAVQRRISDIEVETNTLLRRKMDVGALVRGENAYAIVKCSIKDNQHRPETVYDAILAINILDSELVSPIVHIQAPVIRLLKNLVSDHILSIIDKDIKKANNTLIEEGKEEMTTEEQMFESIKKLDKAFSDNIDDPKDVRYRLLAKNIYESVQKVVDIIPIDDYDPLKLRENIKRILDDVNVRNRGFNTAVNGITRVLDLSRMSYQHIENLKNRRSCVVREYSPSCGENPDENFVIHMDYYDVNQLKAMRTAYQQQYDEVEKAVESIVKLVDAAYINYKKRNNKIDFEDLRDTYLKEEAIEMSNRMWNELGFVPAAKTNVEEEHNTYHYNAEILKKRLLQAANKLSVVYGDTFPMEREVLQHRINDLEGKFQEFAREVNPFQIQPGVLLSIEITTIKRKQVTLHRMANVLNEFLYYISRGFSDTAFANFSRRRSTTKLDEEDEFVMHNEFSEESAAEPATTAG